MSRTIRDSWPWVQAHGPERGSRDQGCGGKCWCKASTKKTKPVRDTRAPQFYPEEE